MHVALMLMLCSAAVHVGVSQSPPTVLPRTETVPPLIQNCYLESDLVPFLAYLPNGTECILGFSMLHAQSVSAVTPARVANALMNVCNDNCGGL